jgi:hypothetical protein
MASQGYWTPSDSNLPKGMNIYHLFLDGTYQPFTDRVGAKLVNQNLTACLDFNPNYTNPRPNMNLNLNRTSCKACLSTSRLSMNDTDGADDCEVIDKEFGAPNVRYLILEKYF